MTRTIDVTPAARAAGLSEGVWPGRVALSLGAYAMCDRDDPEKSVVLSGAFGARVVAGRDVTRSALATGGATLCTIPTGQRFVVRELRDGDGDVPVLAILTHAEWRFDGGAVEVIAEVREDGEVLQ